MNCEFCNKESDLLFEGWFYTQARNNPYARGTASAGLMQLRIACKDCVQKGIDAGMTQVTQEELNDRLRDI